MPTDEPPADGGQLAPLSDARLVEIYRDAVTALLAEVTGLREREAALLAERERLLAVVKVVAEEMPPLTRDMADTDFCDYCGADWHGIDDTPHESDCPVQQARAALAAADAGERA